MDHPLSLARQLTAGFGFGMLLQIGIGPVGLAVIHTAINERWAVAWAMVWGVALTDGFYITLAALGMAALVQLPALRLILGLGGPLVLVYFGLRAWRAPVNEAAAAPTRKGLLGGMLYGVGVTLTSPLTILFWSGVFGRLVLDGRFATPALLAAFGLGCVAATFTAQTAYSLLAGQARRFFSPSVRRWANRIAGMLMIAFACKMALSFWRGG